MSIVAGEILAYGHCTSSMRLRTGRAEGMTGSALVYNVGTCPWQAVSY